jgi:outer membrane receptor protein involved in Fe transport
MGAFSRYAILASGAAVCAIVTPAVAQVKIFDVPAQPAETAVSALGHQAGVQIIAARRVTQGRRTNAVRGNLEVLGALSHMLGGTGLIARQTGPQSYVIMEAPGTTPALLKTSSTLAVEQQRAVSDPAPAANVQAPQTDDGPATTADIVVTGSRIMINGNQLPTPVTVVSPENIARTSPTNVADALNKLPAFALSRSAATTNNASDNFSGNFLNLRGFGINRNLVLLDGHRVAPSSYTGAVDTNILPQQLMQRIDVVTGGASAVYGSDAVSGVINFVLDNKFNGLKALAQSGISDRGDSFSWRAGATYGTNLFGGRGHFEASYEHFRQDGLLSQERRIGRDDYVLAGNGSTASPYHLITNARSVGLFSTNGVNVAGSGPFAGQVFVAPGVFGPFNHGTPQGGPLESGGDGGYASGTSARADLTTNQAFARFDYSITDDVNFYVQGIYAGSKTSSSFFSNLIFPHLIAPDNPYLSPAVRSALTGPIPIARVFINPDGNIGNASSTKVYTGAAGLDGSLGDFRWNVFYEHAQTTTKNSTINNTLEGNMSAALDAVDQGQFQTGVANGNIVCRSSLTNPGAYPGCVPINPFGTDPRSQTAGLDYASGTTFNRPRYKLDDVEVSISGPLFDLWAGPVQAAVSGEYRNLSLNVGTNAYANVFADCTGLRFNCTPGVTNVYRDFNITPISVSQSVKEAAVELGIPLLKDSSIGSMSLNMAGRYTDYSTSGSVWTWKVGGDWAINDQLRLRATRSRDIRAPGLYELFQPATASFAGFQDLHTGANGVIPIVTSGNATLKPEKADTLTFGAVYKPSFLPGFSASVDYYRIKINNAITQIDGRAASFQQLCEASNGVSDFCSLYVRPGSFSDRSAANSATLVKVQSLNVATLKTWGIDGELNYTTSLGGSNRLALRGLVSYQPQLTNVVAPTLSPLYNAGSATGVAKWRLTGFVTFSTPNVSIDLQERWRSGLRWDSNPNLVYAEPDFPSAAYTDVTFTANIGDKKDYQIFLSINNLFDRQPSVYASTVTSGTPGFGFSSLAGDDIIGRYFTAGVRLKL